MLCKQCGAQLSDQEQFCGCCGTPVGDLKKRNRRWIWLVAVIGVLAVIAVVVICLFLSGEADDQTFAKGQIIRNVTVGKQIDGINHEQIYEIEYDGYGLKRITVCEDGILLSESIFDTQRKLPVSQAYYDEHGNVETYYSYVDGNMAESYEYSDGKEIMRTIYKYNAKGLLVERTGYENGIINYSTVYEYDADYNVIKESRLWGDGQESHLTYKYDDRGNKVSESYAGGEDTFKYDENDRLIEQIHTFHGKEETRETYQYDETGNLVESVFYYDGKAASRTTYEYHYDKTGNLTEKVIYKDANEYSSTGYEFDENGYITRIETTSPDGEKTVTMITFDVVSVSEETVKDLVGISDYVMELVQ